MPRANSFDDEGRSLTPDLEDYEEQRREHEEEYDLPPPVSSPSASSALAHPTERPVAAPIMTNVASPTPRRPSGQFRSPRSSSSPLSLRHRFDLHLPGHHSHQPILSPVQGTPTPRYQNPREHFRAAVRKVMAMHRTSHFLSSGAAVGAEPGIDPRRHSAHQFYRHIRQKCVIDIMDYSPLRTSVGRMTNGEFLKLLDDQAASERESWVKVRATL